MSNPLYTNLPAEAWTSDALLELALDLRWSWHHSADALWAQLEPELWDLTHNPWVVLQTVSREKLQSALADPAVRALIDRLRAEQRWAADAPTWFKTAHAESHLSAVAYFSMEFMLSEALPIYSGGLGNVAGDQLKAASDLGVPVIGVGLLYQQGYFRQLIDSHGEQRALYPFNDPGQLPVTPLREANGEWLRLPLNLPGFQLWVRTWQVKAGRAKLYLLDTNDPANTPEYRGITSQLYGGGPELRLVQEMVLGLGGWRLLRALGVEPQVCHLNEGHAAFAVLDRAHSYMQVHDEPFDQALAATRAGNVFTTHTAVAAGFDRFAPDLVTKYLGRYAQDRLGISPKDLLALGRQNPDDAYEPFNMAYLAVRGSGAINAVSKLHGAVSRRLFQPLFPRWPTAEVPVGYVTNGVHAPSWDSAAADKLWMEACGKDRWRGGLENIGDDLRRVPDGRLWEMRSGASRCLVEYTRKRLARQRASQGASAEEVAEAKRIFDPDTLTLGFARRFATYKRPNLLLHDRERLLRILTNRERPVQLVLAGKAHPRDLEGQTMVKEWNDFISRPEARAHVVFLADYDILLTEQLVQGVDVWINTPRRPWEACGTSGMKVLVNGGLNLSELDGWWAEAYSPQLGWAIGDGREHGDDPAWDASEADTLYTILEREVIPDFYARNEQGIPTQWVARMRESMATLTPRFSANRAVREYTERYYLPAATAAAARAARGAELVRWRQRIAQNWAAVRFGELRTEATADGIAFEVQLYAGSLDAADIRVELCAENADGPEPVRVEMSRGERLPGANNGYLYLARVPAGRPAHDYTPRAVPYSEGAEVPLEAPQILWQR